MDRELTCQEVVELVTDYLEDALLEPVKRRLEEHLAGCEPCQIYLDQMRQTVSLIGHLPEESIPPAALDVLLAHLREATARSRAP